MKKSNKETRALTITGNVVTQGKPVPISARSTPVTTEKNKSANSKSGVEGKSVQANSALALKKQPSPEVISGTVALKNENNKNTVLTILSIIVAVAVTGVFAAKATPVPPNNTANTPGVKIAGQQVTNNFRVASAYSDYELSAIASQENAGLPRMINNTTRLDSTIGVSDEFQYNYTLIDVSSDSVAWATLKNTLELALVNWVCTTKHIVETFINKGVTVSFAYFGNDRGLIGVISVEPIRCSSGKRLAAK